MEGPKKLQVLSAEAIAHFQEGISLILSNWWGLQRAIKNCRDNRSHVATHEFASSIFNFFYKPDRKEPIYIDELEDLLDDGLLWLDTEAQDGSVEEVAEKLMIMHEECLVGNYQSVQELKEVKSPPVQHVNQDEDDSDEEEEEEEDDDCRQNAEASDMMVDPSGSLPNTRPPQIQKNGSSHQQMPEAEDGWTVVSSRKGRGRKN